MNVWSPRAFLLAVIVLSGAGGLVLWLVDNKPSSERSPRGGEIYDRLLRAQQAQDARLDRLEAMIDRMARLPAQPPRPARQDLPPAAPSFEQQEASRQRAQREIEERFNSEPVAPAWAARNERMIAAAFAPANLASEDSPVPRMQQASCRARTCRIEVVYASEAQAEEGQVFLYSNIAGTLDRSRPFMRTLPDGSVQLVIYAYSGN